MHTWVTVVIGVVCAGIGGVLLWFAAALSYRFYVVRRGSTAVILRSLPAGEGAGWRHGVVVYGDEGLRYFRLRSARMRADIDFPRTAIELVDRRQPTGTELEIMDESMTIIGVSATAGRVELALNRGSMAAFQSWLESRPSDRSIRRRPGRRR